jgi:predicted DNA-binding transcriptional regulator AlpA
MESRAMSTAPRPGDDSEYVTAATLKLRFGGKSDMWLHRRLRDDAFPKPVYLGTPQRHWRMSDVRAWEARMIEQGCTPNSRQKVQRVASRAGQ